MARELVLDYIIERKRMDDLCGSIIDGRFREQKVLLNFDNLFCSVSPLLSLSNAIVTKKKFTCKVNQWLSSFTVGVLICQHLFCKLIYRGFSKARELELPHTSATRTLVHLYLLLKGHGKKV